ncbi:MAG: ParB/RepB/Spo0J family partition protein [Spirochaetes bacterium]|nr:ParB/RepB/Spo0J family partition protein [Spirochaetota bacterium]
MAKRALGKGLDALFSDEGENPPHEEVQRIPLSRIVSNADQPRKRFDERTIEELADSIKGNGLIQPVVVRRTNSGYEIVVGERRFRAARLAGLEEIPAIVKAFPDDKRFDIALIENLQREDLNPIEEAQAFRAILERDTITQERLAARVGKSRSYIANMLRILDLPEEIQAYVSRGTISVGQAKAILSIPDGEERSRIAARIVKERLSVREVERLTRRDDVPRGTKAAKNRGPSKNPYVAALEERLRTRYGTKVTIDYRNGRGVIRIEFYSDDDLDRIMEEIG